MLIGRIDAKHKIKAKNVELQPVYSFKHLRTMITQDRKLDKVQERATGKLFNGIKNAFFRMREIPKTRKMEIVKKVVTLILTYGSE